MNYPVCCLTDPGQVSVVWLTQVRYLSIWAGSLPSLLSDWPRSGICLSELGHYPVCCLNDSGYTSVWAGSWPSLLSDWPRLHICLSWVITQSAVWLTQVTHLSELGHYPVCCLNDSGTHLSELGHYPVCCLTDPGYTSVWAGSLPSLLSEWPRLHICLSWVITQSAVWLTQVTHLSELAHYPVCCLNDSGTHLSELGHYPVCCLNDSGTHLSELGHYPVCCLNDSGTHLSELGHYPVCCLNDSGLVFWLSWLFLQYLLGCWVWVSEEPLPNCCGQSSHPVLSMPHGHQTLSSCWRTPVSWLTAPTWSPAHWTTPKHLHTQSTISFRKEKTPVILSSVFSLYWAVQWSWFAWVNALCNILRKKSREVEVSLPGRFPSRCCLTLCITMEVEPRIVKQYKCHHCCSCKNYQGKGMGGGKKKCLCVVFLADQKITILWKLAV